MSGFDPRSIPPRTPRPRRMTLVDQVAVAIAPPGRKITEREALLLDELVNRADAREHVPGSGPHMHFRVRRDLDGTIRHVRRRARRHQKRVEQRLRARGELA